MAIPSPTIPSSITAVSAVRLNPTLSNMSFYVFSGLIGVTNTETTLISINDVGKRDIFIALELATDTAVNDDIIIKVKSNGVIILSQYMRVNSTVASGFNEIKLILPANTSLEVTGDNQSSSTARNWSVSAYGTYLGPA